MTPTSFLIVALIACAAFVMAALNMTREPKRGPEGERGPAGPPGPAGKDAVQPSATAQASMEKLTGTAHRARRTWRVLHLVQGGNPQGGAMNWKVGPFVAEDSPAYQEAWDTPGLARMSPDGVMEIGKQ